jgi:signal transduction histidine kinase
MPDDTPVVPDSLTDATEAAAAEGDARLIRSVRWRLLAWSGGTTLLVLLVLGVALYATVAKTLEANGVAVLDGRASQIVSAVTHEPVAGGRPPTDFVFGGGGTFAIIIAPDGTTIGPPQFAVPNGLPDRDAVAGAAGSKDGRDVRVRTVSFEGFGDPKSIDVPVRQLTTTGQAATGTFYVQVLQDRTAEARTLDSILVVLGIGSAVVVLVAVGFGGIYARRALVPIRDSLAAQRTALRRQREFAADASHELRTPLTVIRSSVEHLRRHADEPVASVGDALEDIDAEVGQLTSMVDDLLLLARSDSGAISLERVPLQLDDVAGEAAAALAGPAGARDVHVVVDPEPAPVSGDPARLRQLITILVDNAIRHSPAGGEVRVAVRAADGRATVSVVDQGPGIRPLDLPHVFDRFWRAPDAPDGGTGLGLAIARWIAERHGGSVVASSPEGGGALFTVDLPQGAP